jgi:hypothetical protein
MGGRDPLGTLAAAGYRGGANMRSDCPGAKYGRIGMSRHPVK